MERDPKPDHIGLWHRPNVILEEDYGLFFLWSKEGFSIDEKGVAEISDWQKQGDSLLFTKTYKTGTHLAIKQPLKFHADRKDHGNYEGFWEGGGYKGLFYLSLNSQHSLEKNFLSKQLLELEAHALRLKINKKRQETPFLKLEQIDFP